MFQYNVYICLNTEIVVLEANIYTFFIVFILLKYTYILPRGQNLVQEVLILIVNIKCKMTLTFFC